jgi:hypothetical protein
LLEVKAALSKEEKKTHIQGSVQKACSCSPACVCGCNEGKPCQCQTLPISAGHGDPYRGLINAVRPVPAPYIAPQQTYQPVTPQAFFG